MPELELKFRVPPDTADALRQSLLARGAVQTPLRARYFDTADQLLARHRIAWRMRLEGSQWVQTLKAAGDGAVHRLEHEIPVPGSAADAPAPELRLHAGTEAAARLSAALAASADPALGERHATDVQRLHAVVEAAGGSRIEMAFDTGTASAGGRSVEILELELEHKGGPVQGLFDMARPWILDNGLSLSTITKAERGQRLLEPDAAPRPHRAGTIDLPPRAAAAVLMRRLLQSALEQVLGNASEVAEGSTAPDMIHQLRVGLRRLRTILRELAALSPGIDPGWNDALSTTFAALGEQRDQTAVHDAVQPLLAAAGAPPVEWPAPRGADPVDAVKATAFQLALLDLLALAHAEDDRFAPLSAQATRHLVRDRLSRLHRRVSRAAGRFTDLPLEEQHRVRKQLKRLRYLADLTAPLWTPGRSRRYLKRLAAAQDALGKHNDVAVAAHAYRREAETRPAAWFAAGYLQAHLTETARQSARALSGIGKRLPLRLADRD